MKSPLLQEIDQTLIAATQSLSPEERLNAFLTHCRLVMELCEAARTLPALTVRPES